VSGRERAARYARGMANEQHRVQAVRENGAWQVFIDGFLVTEVVRWPAVGFVAREWIAATEEIASSEVRMTIDVVGRNQYIDVAAD
jgi:hypothetical protein